MALRVRPVRSTEDVRRQSLIFSLDVLEEPVKCILYVAVILGLIAKMKMFPAQRNVIHEACHDGLVCYSIVEN